ncbi:hypothetical protein [Clostridium kluyveri]|uniref:S-layer protein SbsC C-terminal domain-containing protein n=2 Tax=Clostridium kluyveri TaxID=1534 RepID=A5N1W7_CLOK5|nr:hypothetical protein [Clostridium kluyveri]EDK35113.1 Conserved hypothetical protein [Clostridium kluyveri DSM 555]BAH07796.1 hypothetical protein CKR_2745 [Clostridium kluyveri NBRC 12016]
MKLPYKVMSSAALSVVVASIPVIVHAQAGDFYNQTKQLKYSQSDLRSNATLANKLQDEMDNGDTIIKEVTTGQYLDYVKANDAFVNVIGNGGDVNTALTEAITAGATSATSDELNGYTPATPDDETLAVSSVSAITDSKLNIKLSVAVDDATAANFAIAGVTVNSATLSSDKTSVILDVTGLEVGKSYTVKATGLKVNAVTQPDVTKDFTMPDAISLFTPEVTLKDTVLKADGLSSTLITFTLKDANGNVMTDADKVEVAFTATFGTLANQRVTVQNGVATNLFTSETLDSVKPADITATVVEAANKNLIGLKAEKTIVLDPNPTIQDETVGATMTEVQAAQADRVIAYFNKDVDITKFVTSGTYELDASKATATVKTNVANDLTGGSSINVVGVLPVEGNSKALQLILASNLTDNANLLVNFSDKTGTLTVNSEKSCKLTDARKPAMLSVAREGLKTLKVTFSEPVNSNSANALNNWVIDGIRIDDPLYGVSGTTATATVGDFYSIDQPNGIKAGTDTRNVVTITLGKDKDGNQIYFKSGTHSIQGSSIGDWANLTDVGNNVMSTQTLDFDIPVDVTAPNATVEVQSPEQYVVTFDKDLVSPLTVGKLQLQKYNKTTGNWDAYAAQALQVTPIAGTSSYKIEVTKDWTDSVVYDTTNTHLNYYNDNYRLFIAKDSVAAAANGIKNADIALTLEGSMTTPDINSPVINDIAEVKNAGGGVTGYKVTMSEPVKISMDGTTTSDGLPTFSQGQVDKIPVVTAQFIKKDGSKTIDGTVSASADPYDKTISVVPATSLDAGQWTLVVRAISDDVGNTAASANKDFTVDGPTQTTTKFAVNWAFADANGDLDDQDSSVLTGDGADYVYVKFNEPISITGDAKNALKQSNYQLDGMPLPTGTQIRANIAGLDDKDSVSDSITIVLPDGYLNGKEQPHVLTISNYLESTTANDTLTNGGAKTLTWTADSSAVYSQEVSVEQAIYTAEASAVADLTNPTNLATAKADVATAKAALDSFINYLTTNNVTAVETAQLTARYNAVKAKVDATTPAALKNGLTFADALGAGNDGNTQITLGAPSVSGNTFVYKISSDANAVPAPGIGTDVSSWTAIVNNGVIAADNGRHIGVAEVDASGKIVQFSDATAVTVAYVVATPAVKTADNILGSSVAFDTATKITIAGTDVTLTNVAALGGTYDAASNINSVVSALQSDIDATALNGNYTVSQSSTKLVITSTATGATAEVNLTGSDTATGATLLGFTTLTAVNGTAGAN